MSTSTLIEMPVTDRSSAHLTVSVIRTEKELAGLASEWAALFQNSTCSNVFLTFEWMSLWWLHLGRGHKLFVVTVRNDAGRLVALAPLYTARQLVLGIRRLGFLGDTLVGTDYLDVLIDEAYSSHALRTISDFLLASRGEWDYIDLADTTSDSHISTAFRAEIEAGGLKTELSPSSTCPFISLPESPEAYLATLGPKVRKHLRYYERALEKLGSVEFVTAERRIEIEQAFDALLRLHRARFQQRGASSAFVDPRVTGFHRAAVSSLSDTDAAKIHLLKLRGEPIAAVYVLSAGTRTFFYQSGMNPAYGRYSIGSLLIRFAIEQAIRNGCSEFDFLRGDESYKSQWVNNARQMQSVRFFDDRMKSRIARMRHQIRKSLRDCKSSIVSSQITTKLNSLGGRLLSGQSATIGTANQEGPSR